MIHAVSIALGSSRAAVLSLISCEPAGWTQLAVVVSQACRRVNRRLGHISQRPLLTGVYFYSSGGGVIWRAAVGSWCCACMTGRVVIGSGKASLVTQWLA